MGIGTGKPELVLFHFVLFLPYISLECLVAMMPGFPGRAPLRCPPFPDMQSVNKAEFISVRRHACMQT